MKLNPREGTFLIKLARKATSQYLESSEVINVPKDTPKKFLRKSGVFVTLSKQRQEKAELRGCIGYPAPSTQLVQAVIECAISSATQDYRFPPVMLQELESILFEISVLTPPVLIDISNPQQIPSEIKVGINGLIIERGMHKGLLLPQVPIEHSWDEEEFLCQCCLKAGLAPDAWLMNDTKVFKFSCVIAKENEPGGSVTITDRRAAYA
ncbi:MAG: TIGR00296 family protein [Candidatus Bathyarchaeota archaeon]|nr:MAG: TIGR00296 family protein [Candidatus Bathyarchaeota archaeon]